MLIAKMIKVEAHPHGTDEAETLIGCIIHVKWRFCSNIKLGSVWHRFLGH